jgi:hypothetical protein
MSFLAPGGWVPAVAALVLCLPTQVGISAPLAPEAFLSRYCLACHGTGERQADRRFDDLPLTVGADVSSAERWQEVLHQLQLGDMPPTDEPQPTVEERRAMIAWIERQVTEAQTLARDRDGKVVHRRLNRAEYLHTVQDLFGFGGDFDPTGNFPGDEELDGFRTIGSALRVSRHHLEQYLEAADEILAQAYDLADVNGRPELRTWRDSAETRKGLIDAFGLGVVDAEKANGPAYIYMSHGLRNAQLIFDSKLFLSDLSDTGVRHTGWYDVEIEASAVNRHHPYGRDLMNEVLVPLYGDLQAYYDESQPMRLGIGRQAEGVDGNGWRLIPPNIVEATELPDDRFITVRARIWLDRGTVPYLAWIDGPPKGTRTHFVSTKLHKYDPAVPEIEQNVWENLALRAARDKRYRHRYQGPEIRVRSWQVRGPLREGTAHPARALLFASIAPEERRIEPARLQAELRGLASRLFRRDVTAEDVGPFVEAVRVRLDGETRYADAVRPIFKALLCSSEFLFITEPETDATTIAPHQYATRLSYFLTAGPPDDTLRSRAADGPLDAAAIRAETDRMLDSPRGERFLRLFSEQWLGLNKLGTMPPAKETFPTYYIDRLESAMREETWRLIAELIRTDQPVTALVDANFTYVNAGLARLYDLSDVRGDELRRVSLAADSPRRGLLGHASVLTITANGVETSPVTRGVWVLEKLFGTPPSPPPPDVPPIEPDIRGATTIRQQLEKHRGVRACADCHARIDPLGFALEEYDPIGRHRAAYPNGTAIDTTGEYRGRTLSGPADIRAYLVDHPEFLARNLASRLLTYALGRPLGFADEPALRRLQAHWHVQGNTLRELIHLVAGSELMHRP